VTLADGVLPAIVDAGDEGELARVCLHKVLPATGSPSAAFSLVVRAPPRGFLPGAPLAAPAGTKKVAPRCQGAQKRSESEGDRECWFTTSNAPPGKRVPASPGSFAQPILPCTPPCSRPP
jgi:hypothetical protein